MAKAPDVAAFIRAVLVDTSGRRQPHVEFATGCLGVAQQRFCAWKRVTIFKPRDGGLAGAHPGRKLGLRQACAQASGAVRRLSQIPEPTRRTR